MYKTLIILLALTPLSAIAGSGEICELHHFQNLREAEDLYVSAEPRCIKSGDFEKNNFCGYLRSATYFYAKEFQEIEESQCDFSSYIPNPHFYPAVLRMQKFHNGSY